MKFQDLLDVLESDEKLVITVANEWGDGLYEGTVKELRQEEVLLDLRVMADSVYTRLIEDKEHSDVRDNKVALTTEIEVTLYDDEQTIIYPEDDEVL